MILGFCSEKNLPKLNWQPLTFNFVSLWQMEYAFRELKSGLEVRQVFLRTEDRARGPLVVCILALVMEISLARLLKAHASPGSYREVLSDLEQMYAVCFENRGKLWLWRTELTGQAFDAFLAVGMRPPARVQPLN